MFPKTIVAFCVFVLVTVRRANGQSLACTNYPCWGNVTCTNVAFTEDFNAPSSRYFLNGTATLDAGSLRLTPDSSGVWGSINFLPLSPDPVLGFSLSFMFRIGGSSQGADGIGFALYDISAFPSGVAPSPRGVREITSDSGLRGNDVPNPNPALVVGIETYAGTPAGGNNINVRFNSTEYLAQNWVPWELSDSQWHRCEVVFVDQQLSVSLFKQNTSAAELYANISLSNFLQNPTSIAFGSSTGTVWDEHHIDDVVFSPILNSVAGRSCGPCPAGYEGDGSNCTNIDACMAYPCFFGVTCTDLPPPANETGRTCGPCPAGYVGDGITCGKP